MKVKPIEFADARKFVAEFHRHHKPPVSHRFSLGVYDDNSIVGVAIFGRPIARCTDPLEVLEVARVCTDGTRNACSMLLGAGTRVARAMGYSRIQTFTLDSEPGSSLRAVGWKSKVIDNGFGWLSRDKRNPDGITTRKRKWWADL